jgi:acetylornithine deacetylase
MLCAHIDTVSPSDEYYFDPYTPDYAKASEVIGSKEIIAGLGSNDDGASVVSMIATFRHFTERFLDSSFRLTRNDNTIAPSSISSDTSVMSSKVETSADLLLVLSCEEERSGVNGMTGLWPEIKTGVDYAIVGEPTCMQAATAERGLLVIDATAHGVSGHAARNEGVNAIDIALQDILNLKNHEFTKISPRMGKVNLNVTQINAGTAHNVIPDTCTFVIDIRPTEQYTNEEILNELQSICKSELKARNLSNRSSATHENSPLQSVAEKIGIETFSSPTTSDWMRIDCDAIKMGPGNSSRSHKKDEFIYISEIETGIKTYIDFINNL